MQCTILGSTLSSMLPGRSAPMNLESSASTLHQAPAPSVTGAQADQRPGRRVRGTAFYTVVRALSVIVVLGTWEVLGAQINPIFLSTPSRIAVALFNLV